MLQSGMIDGHDLKGDMSAFHKCEMAMKAYLDELIDVAVRR